MEFSKYTKKEYSLQKCKVGQNPVILLHCLRSDHKLMDNIIDSLMQKWLNIFHRFWLFKKNCIVTDSTDQLNNHINHQLFIHKLTAGCIDTFSVQTINGTFLTNRISFKVIQNIINDGYGSKKYEGKKKQKTT